MAEPLTGPLRESHDYLLARFASLLDVLLAERAALTGRSADALHEVIVRKEALCGEIAARQQTLLDALGGNATLPDSMAQLRAVAERCRSENALNGRIANRARRTTRALLGILTGEDAAELYGAPGRGSRTTAAGHHLGSA